VTGGPCTDQLGWNAGVGQEVPNDAQGIQAQAISQNGQMHSGVYADVKTIPE
jgi:hypothetical protein